MSWAKAIPNRSRTAFARYDVSFAVLLGTQGSVMVLKRRDSRPNKSQLHPLKRGLAL